MGPIQPERFRLSAAVRTAGKGAFWAGLASTQTGDGAVELGEQLPLCTCMCRRRQQQPTPVLLPGKSHGRRGLVGCGPWGRKESDTTERLHFHFSLSHIGEGNGHPVQCSCLETPRDGGAWLAAVYGVAQSQTRLT